MSNRKNIETNFREYLLGNDPSPGEKFEERLMTDDDFFREFQIQEEELIQDYADGNLHASEREAFEKHFLVSAERQEKLDFARSLRKHIDESTDKSKIVSQEKTAKTNFFSTLFSSPLPAAICLLVILALVCFIVWDNWGTKNDTLIALESLDKAFANERPLESRISGFSYAPKLITRGEEKIEPDNLELEKAGLLLLRLASDQANEENLHALGKYYLAQGKFFEAIASIEKAEKFNANNIFIKNDLGVAYLELAKTDYKLDDGEKFYQHINLSLGNLNRAIEIDSSFLAAHFNRALALQKMKTSRKALDAWNNYLKLDSSSMWAEEARKNIEQIKQNENISKENSEILDDFLAAYKNKNEDKVWSILSETKEFITGAMVTQQLIKSIIEASLTDEKETADEMLLAFEYLGKVEKKKRKIHIF